MIFVKLMSCRGEHYEIERSKLVTDPPAPVAQYCGIFRPKHFNYMVSKLRCQYSCPLLAGAIRGFKGG